MTHVRALLPSGMRPAAEVRRRLTTFYRTSDAYAHHQARHDHGYFRRYRDVLDATPFAPRPHILEVGAGAGIALKAFLSRFPGARAVALDLRLASPGTRGPLRPVVGDALDLPFASGTFDAVIGFEVIEHFPDVERAVREMLRVLRRPGHLICGLPNHASLWTPLEDAVRGRTRLAFGVHGRADALRWWWQNVRLMARKRMSRGPSFRYRIPQLDAGCGGDRDAVYYACPLDLVRFLRTTGAELVCSAATLRFGGVARLMPLEWQGSAVLAWQVNRSHRPEPRRSASW